MTTSDADLSPMKRALLEIRDLRARVAAADGRGHEPIAIVGMGMRFPGGSRDADSFWRLLEDGRDAIGEVPADRWDVDALYAADPDTPGHMTTRWGGFLDDIDRFDADFFGISPREAETMDPQQRLLLQVTWEALEDAGIPADRLFGTRTGMYIGIGNSDHMRLVLADREHIDTYATTGNALSVAAGRLAYVLGTNGPAMAIDTACSSSLVALHTAVRALRSGDCELAVAGGVNVILAPELTINFSRARMMASDGRCKAFDAAADGYVRSEGCAVVVLKRLEDAIGAGDRVLAVVRGTAVNQDGRSGGLTAPNGPAQEAVVSAALADAGARPEDVVYVETHGTGTLLGDPIEAGALGASLCRDRPSSEPLLLGSVKTNIGHTETAAGIAGVVKAVLVLQRSTVPPHLHLTELNPHIAAAGLALAVPTTATSLPGDPGSRLVGVSSFGLSGTNAHVVLGDAPPEAVPVASASGEAGAVRVLPLSARSEWSLDALAARHADALEATDDLRLAEVALAAGTMRSHLSRRLAVVAVDRASTIAALRAPHVVGPADGSAPFARTSELAPGGTVAFLFTGHGSHHRGAGRQLYATEPIFRSAVDECAEILDGLLDVPLTSVMFDEGPWLDDMTYAQPGLFALQHALARQWTAWGVRPAAVAGHSAGEYAAAVLAGVMSLEDGLRLIATRGRLLGTIPEPGQMVALFLDEATVADAIVGLDTEVGIAAVNGPFTTVISGRRAAVDEVVARLDLDDGELRRLPISVAAHSPLVDPVLAALAAEVSTASLVAPSTSLVSSMTGRFVDAELTEPGYWSAHTRAPVRFAEVFDTLRAAGCRTFVEIGPGSTLLDLGRRNWPDAEAVWVPSLRVDEDETTELAKGLAAVYVAGADVDWSSVGADPSLDPRHVSLPTYPWHEQSHPSATARSRATSSRPLYDTVASAASRQAEQGPLDLRADLYPRRWELADQAATAAIVRTLRAVGLFTTDGESRTTAELHSAGAFGVGHQHLLTRWIDHLVADGLLERHGESVVSRHALPDADVDGAVAALSVECAGIEPFAEYVARCCDQLTAVVTGRESPLNTLFPGGSYETVDFNYGTWAVARYFNSIVRASVEGAIAARPDRVLRVLEVGAGTGGTTAAVVPSLPPDRVSYTFTDVSSFFLTRAAERFAEHPFMGYAELDLEVEPSEQGFAVGSFDVVVAANVLHATRDLDRTLGHVRDLLAPGGVLVALESTSHPRFFDVTTGLIEGWERFDDEWRDDVPLIGSARWQSALGAAGFEATAVEPTPDAVTASLLQNVVLARAPGEEAAAVAPSTPDATAAPGASPGVGPASAAVPDALARLASCLPDERHDVMVDIVREGVAAVLRVVDPKRLGRDEPLLDLGFDSLMAVELRNVLREALHLERKLPATLAFDHPTIGAIATYLEARLTTGEERVDASPAGGASDTALGADAASLTDDEAEALLLARLEEIEP